LFSIHQVKPVLLIPLVISIALFENSTGSAAFGLIAGFLWDFASGKVFGFYGMALMLCCLAITLLSMYLVRVNIINALIVGLSVSVLCNVWNFIFYYLIWGYEHVWRCFGSLMLSSIYTTVFVFPMFYLVRMIANKFNLVTRT
ncbi:MAG: rod shape-determining protein MreD, partial [Oscillospiraceae bacterium]